MDACCRSRPHKASLASPFAGNPAVRELAVLKSGYLKISSWERRSLFRRRSRAATGLRRSSHFGELFFPVLVIAGLFGRLSALGLFAVNAMAVISYRHVLLTEGFEAALGQHMLWGFMLLTLAVYGPGRWSADYALRRRLGSDIW